MATTKKLEMNWVGHCYGTFEGVKSDKVYIYTIRSKVSGEYEVVGKWGPRTRVDKSKVKSTVFNMQQAKAQLRDAVLEKQKGGYKDITDSAYSGPCKLEEFQKLFENDEIGPTVLATEAQDTEFGLGDAEDLIVECINNTDLEENFDMGVKYLVRDISLVGKKYKTKREAFKFTSLVGIEDKQGNVVSTSPKRFKLVVGEE